MSQKQGEMWKSKWVLIWVHSRLRLALTLILTFEVLKLLLIGDIHAETYIVTGLVNIMYSNSITNSYKINLHTTLSKRHTWMCYTKKQQSVMWFGTNPQQLPNGVNKFSNLVSWTSLTRSCPVCRVLQQVKQSEQWKISHAAQQFSLRMKVN